MNIEETLLAFHKERVIKEKKAKLEYQRVRVINFHNAIIEETKVFFNNILGVDVDFPEDFVILMSNSLTSAYVVCKELTYPLWYSGRGWHYVSSSGKKINNLRDFAQAVYETTSEDVTCIHNHKSAVSLYREDFSSSNRFKTLNEMLAAIGTVETLRLEAA